MASFPFRLARPAMKAKTRRRDSIPVKRFCQRRTPCLDIAEFMLIPDYHSRLDPEAVCEYFVSRIWRAPENRSAVHVQPGAKVTGEKEIKRYEAVGVTGNRHFDRFIFFGGFGEDGLPGVARKRKARLCIDAVAYINESVRKFKMTASNECRILVMSNSIVTVL